MTLPRIPLAVHGAAELLAGLVLLAAAFVVDLGTAGTVVCFAAGVLTVGLGLAGSDALPLAVHQSLDQALIVALSAGAVVAALDGGSLAATLLLVVAVVQLALLGATRWTRRLA